MTEFVSLTEIETKTERLKDQGSGHFAVGKTAQRLMLHAFLNVAKQSLEAGIPSVALPAVVIEYRKVTRTPKRIRGEHFAGMVGVPNTTHIGRVTSVFRSAAGNVVVRVKDATRAGEADGFTAIRLEGIQGFGFAEPAVQRAFLARAAQVGA